MAIYVWEGKTRAGSASTGSVQGDSEAGVIAQLKSQNVMVTKVKLKPKDLSEYLAFLTGGVKTRDLVILTRQLATMIDAGLPLVQCLDILGHQQPSKVFKKIVLTVKSDLEGGMTFADALAKHPTAFDNLYVNLIAAGEVGGILDTILNRLATYMEKADELKRKVKGAMVYPISICVIAAGVVVLMLVKVIPVFEKMFSDFGGELPGPTRMVLQLSNFMQHYLLHGAVGLVAMVFALRWVYSTERGRLFFDSAFLKMPIFGPLLRKVAVSRFSRTLSTMLSSGVPILDALSIVGRTAGNVVIENAIMQTKASIAEGKTIAEPLAASKVFPSMVVQMIGVGEQTGAIDSMLAKIADFYDGEVDVAVEALTSLLEPIMLVGLGGTVGTLLVAMYLPIFKIADAVK
jgi:type IV pilus assembly protein PilC